MLHQIDIYLHNADISELYSDLGIKLHGFIMSKIQSAYADLLHKQEPRPFSLFVYNGGSGFVCRVSALNDEAAQIIDALETTDKITVYGIDKPLVVGNISLSNPIDAADIPAILHKNKYSLDIVTPAVRKTNGRYTNPPDLRKYFTSVANKLKAYENISIDDGVLDALFAEMKISRYIFESRDFMLGGKKIPAVTGGLDVSLKSGADMLKLLLGYATYSGIGAKTSLGMGGFLVR